MQIEIPANSTADIDVTEGVDIRITHTSHVHAYWLLEEDVAVMFYSGYRRSHPVHTVHDRIRFKSFGGGATVDVIEGSSEPVDPLADIPNQLLTLRSHLGNKVPYGFERIDGTPNPVWQGSTGAATQSVSTKQFTTQYAMDGTPFLRADGLDDMMLSVLPDDVSSLTSYTILAAFHADNPNENVYILCAETSSFAMIYGFVDGVAEWYETPRASIGSVVADIPDVYTVEVDTIGNRTKTYKGITLVSDVEGSMPFPEANHLTIGAVATGDDAFLRGGLYGVFFGGQIYSETDRNKIINHYQSLLPQP